MAQQPIMFYLMLTNTLPIFWEKLLNSVELLAYPRDVPVNMMFQVTNKVIPQISGNNEYLENFNNSISKVRYFLIASRCCNMAAAFRRMLHCLNTSFT